MINLALHMPFGSTRVTILKLRNSGNDSTDILITALALRFPKLIRETISEGIRREISGNILGPSPERKHEKIAAAIIGEISQEIFGEILRIMNQKISDEILGDVPASSEKGVAEVIIVGITEPR